MTLAPRLPPVDRDSLLIEHDPRILNAYARGLWRHWQDLIEGKVDSSYNQMTVKAATIWLIDRYVDEELPLPYEAARLVRSIIGHPRDAEALAAASSISPVRKTSDDAYWGAIRFEAGHQADPTGKQPSVASLYSIAKHVREGQLFLNKRTSQATAESTVRDWRRKTHYRDNVVLYRHPPV